MRDSGKKILVTGATGFIGMSLVQTLVSRDLAVKILIRDEGRNCVDVTGQVEVCRGDLGIPDTLIGLEEGVETVVHSAGMLGKWGTREEELRRVNVDGALNLLNQFKGADISRFIYLSAAGVTGPLQGTHADETYVCKPVTNYEKTKLMGEKRALQFAAESLVPVTVVRPTFTYGPGDQHKLGLFQAIKNGRFAFIGNGESVNHPVYINDLIDGILLAMEKGKKGEIYIIGGEAPVTKNELINTIADALGVSRPRLHIPRLAADGIASVLELAGSIFNFEPVLTRSRVMMMGDSYGYSIEKAKRELGYYPSVGLKQGIMKTVQYYEREGLL